MEIFKYDESTSAINMTRFDDSSDWNYLFCPILSTPWQFCEALRDGNEMFWPALTSQQQTDLRNEALLIGKQFNYVTIHQTDFENVWSNIEQSRTELGRIDWKYQVIHNVDSPLFLDQAWRNYLLGNRPAMPNVNSPKLPPVCYRGTPAVTLVNGQRARINGEICYTPGTGYTFTAD